MNFKGRHFDKIIILMSVRWYCAYALSYRNIEELMKERGVSIDHATIQRWVVKYAPQLEANFRRKHKRAVGKSWRMDETYIKVRGKWHYLYRAVDKAGGTIDFMLSETRDKKAAVKFFSRAIGEAGLPETVTVDKSGANLAALTAINALLFMAGLWPLSLTIRQNKYLNNVIEQDHRGIKRVTKATLGFKCFNSAKAALAGIELHHMLRKGQHKQSGELAVWEQFYALAE